MVAAVPQAHRRPLAADRNKLPIGRPLENDEVRAILPKMPNIRIIGTVEQLPVELIFRNATG
jgi:hypothetical protein